MRAGNEGRLGEPCVKRDFTSLGWYTELAVSQQSRKSGIQTDTKKKPLRAASSREGMLAKRLRQRICPDIPGPIHRIGAFQFVHGGRHATGTRNHLHGSILLVVLVN